MPANSLCSAIRCLQPSRVKLAIWSWGQTGKEVAIQPKCLSCSSWGHTTKWCRTLGAAPWAQWPATLASTSPDVPECWSEHAVTKMIALYGKLQWEKWILICVLLLRKPGPAHHWILVCWALFWACRAGLISPTGAFYSILIFLYERKLGIKLAKTDLLTLFNEARAD